MKKNSECWWPHITFAVILLVWLDIMQRTNACKHQEFPMKTDLKFKTIN